MKRSYFSRVLSGILAAFCMAGSSAFADTLTYSPSVISATIAGGATADLSLTIGLDQNEGNRTYYTWLKDSVSGTLPDAWLSISPAAKFLSPTASQVIAILTITVPPDTPSGTYSSVLYSKALASHRYAGTGTGVSIEVKVPAVCSGVPQIKDMTVNPAVLWPPNKSLTMVTVSGTIEMPSGCKLVNAGYSVDDEYGIYTDTGTVSVEAEQKFHFIVPVEAWREGQDKDGRIYRIRVFGEDEAGIGSSGVFTVLVPHDQRDKKEQ